MHLIFHKPWSCDLWFLLYDFKPHKWSWRNHKSHIYNIITGISLWNSNGAMVHSGSISWLCSPSQFSLSRRRLQRMNVCSTSLPRKVMKPIGKDWKISYHDESNYFHFQFMWKRSLSSQIRFECIFNQGPDPTPIVPTFPGTMSIPSGGFSVKLLSFGLWEIDSTLWFGMRCNGSTKSFDINHC